MSECFAVSVAVDGYTFAPSEHGDIHLFEIAETGEIQTITMEESTPAKTLIEELEIENFYRKSQMGETGTIGLHVGELDRFIDGTQLSPYSITVAPDVKAYIEGDA